MTRRDYTPIYDGDRYCLMCRHVCPVERITKREATSPHGWALLIASVQRGLLDWDADSVDTLYQCADCGLCQANCATDRPLPAAIVAARAAVVEAGKGPQAVSELDVRLRAAGHPYAGPAPTWADDAAEPATVGLFVGAATVWERPATVTAALELLRAAGVTARLLSAARSGIYLPYTVGLWDTARRLGEATLAEIAAAGVGTVLTLCKEDAQAFAHVYPEIGLTLPDGVAVVEFSDWLAAQVAEDRLHFTAQERGAIAYHDPCHTPRLPQTGAARRLVAALTGAPPVELFWRGQRAAPCGALGGFPFTAPALGAALAGERLTAARAAGATLLVTDDPQCTAHLARHADGIEVGNLIELAAAQLAARP